MTRAWILALALPVSVQAAGNPDFTLRSGARALGMGEASSAASQGWESLAFNPAGLAGQSGLQVGLGHTDWVGMSAESLAVVSDLGPGAIGVSGFYNGAPDLVKRDAQGQAVGNLVYRNMGGTVAWGQSMGSLALGMAGGGWQLENAGTSNAGAQLNAGGQYRVGGLTLGAAGFQIESKASWQGSVQWAQVMGNQTMRLGGGFISEGADSRWGLGGELTVLSRLALRGGWQQPTQTSALEGLNGLTAGFGLQLGSMELDYAWMPLGELGNVQRGQVSWRLEGAGKVQEPEAAKVEEPMKAKAAAETVAESEPKKEVKLKFVVPAE